MYCTYCGQELPDGAHFCPKCGISVDTGTPSQAFHRSSYPREGATYRPSMNYSGQFRISFNIPETERSNEVRLKIDGTEVFGLFVGIRHFTVCTTPGAHEIEFISSPRSLLGMFQKIARGKQTVLVDRNRTIDLVRNGNAIEFTGCGSAPAAEHSTPTTFGRRCVPLHQEEECLKRLPTAGRLRIASLTR